MAKIIYNIRCKKDGNVVVEKLSGYTFKVDDLRFGVSNELSNGRKREVWSVTELSSGYECLIGDTKKTAINKVLDKTILDKIRKYLDDAKLEDVNKDTSVSVIYRTKAG